MTNLDSTNSTAGASPPDGSLEDSPSESAVSSPAQIEVYVRRGSRMKVDAADLKRRASVKSFRFSTLRNRLSRVLLQLAAAFILYWISYGTDLADGIIYARLIQPPCGAGGSPSSSNDTSPNDSLYAGNLSGVSESQSLTTTIATATSDDGYVSSFYRNGTMSTSTFGTGGENANKSGGSECGGFGRGASQTAWVTSLATAVRVGFAWTAGVFIDAFGVPATVVSATIVFSLGTLLSTFATELYQVYLARGILAAMGSGVLFAAPIHCLALTFDQKIGIATGFSYAGSGIGAVVFGYAGKEVIALGDWQWYYRMVACIGLLGIPCAFVLHIKPATNDSCGISEHTGNSSYERALQKLRKGFRDLYVSLRKGKVLYHDVDFLLISGCYILYALGYFFPYISSGHRLEALGIQSSDAYLQSAYIGFGVFAGCSSLTVFSIFFTVRGTLYQGIALIVMGMATILSIFATTENSLVAYNIFYAAVSGVAVAACGPASREVVPAEMTVHAFGHLYLLSSPAMALGPPLSGWIFDLTQSYTLPSIVGGLLLIISAFLILAADFRIRRRKRCQKQNEVEAPEPVFTLRGVGRGDFPLPGTPPNIHMLTYIVHIPVPVREQSHRQETSL